MKKQEYYVGYFSPTNRDLAYPEIPLVTLIIKSYSYKGFIRKLNKLETKYALTIHLTQFERIIERID